MLLARSLVLGLRSRAVLAVALVALSVAYAIVAGAATSGLQEVGGTLTPDLRAPSVLVAQPGLAPFPDSQVPDGATRFRSAPWEGLTLGTVEPWPHGAEAVPGPYARVPPGLRAVGDAPLAAPRAHEAPWDWVLVPPATFARLAPERASLVTFALAPHGASVAGAPSPAAGAFLERGAAQVGEGLALVVAAVALVVAFLAGGVLRLELLARERDYATVEALGGRGAARRAAVLRAAWVVGLGVGLGAVAGVALAALGGRALGVAAVRAEPAWVALVVVVSFAAGVAAGAAGALLRLRVPLGQRLGRRGPSAPRFPGPVRFLLVTPRVAPSAVAAAVVLASVSSVVLAAAGVPFTVFEPQDGTQVVGRAPGNPFRGSADRFLGEHLTLFDGIEQASPETFAPTVLQGRPVLVRGVDLDGWRGLTGARLAEGRWPASPDEATAGARLARALHLGPGEVVVAPGAYRATVRAFQVVGVHLTGALEDDELLVGLDAAGDLAGLPPGEAHLLRVRGAPGALEEALRASPVRVLDIAVDPPEPVPLTLAVARVRVLNVADAEADRPLALRVDGNLSGSAVARVPARAERVLAIPFLAPAGADFTLEVNPELAVNATAPTLRVEAPATVAANATYTVRVLDAQGAPVAGAQVEGANATATTDLAGAATLPAGPPGAHAVAARFGALRGAAQVYVVEPAWALSPRLAAEHALVLEAAGADAGHVRYHLLVGLVNLGGAPFEGNVTATALGLEAGNATASVPARARATLELNATVPRAARALEVAGLSVPLAADSAEAPSTQRPRTVAEVLEAKRRAAAEREEVRQLSGRAFLEDAFAALEPSAALVVLATFLHAGAVVAVAVLREVRERDEVLAILRDLGAGPDDLVARGAREALLAALPGLLLGVAVVGAAFAVLQPMGFPAAFGHTIPAGTDPGFLARVAAALALAAVLAGAWAARTPPEQPLRQAPPQPLAALVEGAP